MYVGIFAFACVSERCIFTSFVSHRLSEFKRAHSARVSVWECMGVYAGVCMRQSKVSVCRVPDFAHHTDAG